MLDQAVSFQDNSLGALRGVMQPDEGVQKGQDSSKVHRWAIGIALVILGLGAWSLSRHGFPNSKKPSVIVQRRDRKAGQALSQRSEALDSLEDALSALEQMTLKAEDSQDIQTGVQALATLESEVAALKKLEKAPVVEPPPQVSATASAAGKTSKKGKKTRKASSVDKREASIEEALGNLQAAPAGKMTEADEADKQKSINDALEKMWSQTASQASLPSEADKTKARGIIRDFMNKLEASGKKADTSLTRKLEALISGKDDGDAVEQDQEVEAPPEEGPDSSHLDFARQLKEEHSKKSDVALADVKEDFARMFPNDARPLLCSGCKFVAARLDSELSEHDVQDQENPALMLAAKRRAIDATCGSFRHIRVVHGDEGGGSPRFEAVEASQDPQDGSLRVEQKLCVALLEDAKFDLLAKMIRRNMALTSAVAPGGKTSGPSENWERWLCAQRARLCKRSEVREDDEDDEQEL